jgi:DNA-binding IclR family transcriptional regulator
MAETSKTVRNALQLLSCFTRNAATLSASELARQLKLPRTNVLRLLATLEAFGFVERATGNHSFRIGLRAFEIGSLFLVSNPISSLLANALDELVVRTQCTAYLAVLDKEDVVMLSCREGSLPVRFVWQIGDRLPAYTTALGKAMLMHLTPEQLDGQIGGRKNLRILTQNSLRTRDALNRELEVARKRGWGFAREESHPGLTAVGAAIVDQQSHPIAAISISYFDHPPQPKRIEKFAEIVMAVAKNVSRKISSQNIYDGRKVPKASIDVAIVSTNMGQQSARMQNSPTRARIRR